MASYYSPQGNLEIWETKPEGYFSMDEWQETHAPPAPPEPALEEVKAAKLLQIDAETTAAINAGFNYTVPGHGSLHFAFESFDQQNFADAANLANLAVISGNTSQSVNWNAYAAGGELVRVALDVMGFVSLYQFAVLSHKGALMEMGGARKLAVAQAASVEAVEAA